MNDGWQRLQELVKAIAAFLRRTSEREAIAAVLGRRVGRRVLDGQGNVLAEAGDLITPEMAERARRAGKLPALIAAVVASEAQDLRERWDEWRLQTAEGQEEAALASVEDYAAARGRVGHVLTTDVTDARGHVILRAGKRLTEEDVRIARERGVLHALMASASPLPQSAASDADGELPRPAAREPDLPPEPGDRPRLPLLDMPEAPTEHRSSEDTGHG